jgi:hypothetical protein
MDKMANIRCKVCNEKGCDVMTQNKVSKELSFYCCRECADEAMRIKFSGFINREIEGLTDLRDNIKEQTTDWKRLLPLVYGLLMFYLALKRRDTRSRLERLFDLALKKNQEVFSEVDGDTEFKEENPAVLLVVTKYLVKATQDKVVMLIDFFATTDSVTETI